MINKTRKYAWPASAMMAFALVAALAAFIALSGSSGVALAHEPDTNVGNHCAGQSTIAHDVVSEIQGLTNADGSAHTCDEPGTEPAPEPTPAPTPVASDHASTPVMFGVEGLDNGARLNWGQPKLRAPGAEVIGYRIDRDAWNANAAHPINDLGDDTIDLLNLSSVLAADHSDRGLAYETVYIYKVQAIVEYDVKHWWNNLSPAMKNTVVVGGGMYDSLNDTAKAAVHRAYGLQARKYPVDMVDAWWDNLNCAQMNDAVSPMAGEPPVGPDNATSPYCAMYDDLTPAAVMVVDRAHYNSYNRYAFGEWSERRSITTATSGGLLDALLAPPSAPVPVGAAASCDDQIMVTWMEPSDFGKVPAQFPGCKTCTNQTPIHIGGNDAGIEIQPGTAVIKSYMVERKVGNGPWMTVASNLPATARSWDDDEGLTYGMTYHYRVRATNNADLTGPAGMGMVTLIEPPAPLRPSSLVVNLEQDHTLFELQWDPPGDTTDPKLWRTETDFVEATANDYRSLALSYLVERQVGDGAWMSIIQPNDDPEDDFEDYVVPTHVHLVTLPNGKTQYALRHEYSREGLMTVRTQEHRDPAIARGMQAQDVKYRVSALVKSCNHSPWNQADEVEVPAAVAPGMPTGLDAMGHADHVDLSWTAPEDDGGSPITGYSVQYRIGDGSWFAAMPVGNVTSYSHTGLMAGTTYEYRVTAMNAIDTSMPSATTTAMTEAAPPPPPLGGATGLSAMAGADAGTVQLSWMPGPNATRHYLAGVKVSDWSANDFSNVIFRATASNSADTVTGLDSGEQYAFTVLSGNASGWDDTWATIVYVTPN